jgi:hypothetical protein
MTNLEKRDQILQEIAKNNSEFIRQAKLKINKKIAPDPSDPLELVSDVIYSIVVRLDNTKDLNKFYRITKEGQIGNYIFKAIDRNARYLNTPFGRKKLVVLNRIEIHENMAIEADEEDEDQDLIKRASYIKSLFDSKEGKEIFGDRWKLFKILITEYTATPDCTYQKLSDKYNIPLGSVSWMFGILKTKIQERLKNDKKWQSLN